MESRADNKRSAAEERRRAMSAKSLGGGLIVCVHRDEPPSDEEWNQILALFRGAPDLQEARVLVFTLGGAPDARQRARLNTVVGNARPRISVITPSALARAAGIAISWFIPTLKMFDPQSVERALDHLEVGRIDREALSRGLAEVRRELGI